jgi:Fe2+ transport system protein FeoA
MLFDTSNNMNLLHAPIHSTLMIKSFPPDNHLPVDDVESRLMHLGFIFGAEIKIVHQTLLQKSFLVEVRGRKIALTFNEASRIMVEVIA